MTFAVRLGIIAFWPLLAVAVIVQGGVEASLLPPAPAEEVAGALTWLAVCTGLYLLNHVVAWRYPDSWPLFVTRALLWAVIAYLCICKLIDLVGGNPDAVKQIIGLPGYASRPGGSEGLGVQITAWAVALAMAAVCIGLGFESTGQQDGPGPSA